MESLLTPAVWLTALLIFVLRVMDMSMDTIRVLVVVRGRKLYAWLLGFFQSVIFIVAIANVLTGKANLISILAYATGFATGNVVGMLIEERIAMGHVQINVVSSLRGALLAETLRKSGFAVTEIPARGKDGAVLMLSVSVKRKDASQAETVILETDPDAFVIAEDVRAVRKGFWRV